MMTYQAIVERPPEHMLDCFVVDDSNWLNSDAADRPMGRNGSLGMTLSWSVDRDSNFARC
ncbi:hypothetical protein BK664_25640 [Pseudomonas brassicacearum]|jgi:hypothetical protein|uniref:Uncharacterized protein n=1 Tax=Pseudomonas brassicacearum TaxID=930166 RepID=A0A423J887_9PSED|nr:hypothetical protein BK664_25640 [Pseudomonas brassicacearum]